MVHLRAEDDAGRRSVQQILEWCQVGFIRPLPPVRPGDDIILNWKLDNFSVCSFSNETSLVSLYHLHLRKCHPAILQQAVEGCAEGGWHVRKWIQLH